ncbi:MAG TPA: hypothetical protein VKA74_02385, partial [Myxococcota bacterium]|nr:hypothetical protein [Myxococcota bacterium]
PGARRLSSGENETPIEAGRKSRGKMKRGYFWPVHEDQDEEAFPFAKASLAVAPQASSGVRRVRSSDLRDHSRGSIDAPRVARRESE